VPKGLEGVSSVLRLPHGDCANAIGAAIAQVSGEIDQVFRDMSREEALAEAARLAAAGAVASGADPATLTVVDSEDIPIAYLPGNARRIRVRCVGDIGLSRRDLSASPDPRSAS
jgi:hypothetical protein